jgi:hypothetical protein
VSATAIILFFEKEHMMVLTQEMRNDIELLTMAVADDVAIVKALRRKHGVHVSVLLVRGYRKVIARELPPTPVDKPELKVEKVAEVRSLERDQVPITKNTSSEIGSAMLLASMCRWAFKHDKLLPNLTLAEQRTRARADGYSGSIEGWA